jgi:putative addiction module antidote
MSLQTIFKAGNSKVVSIPSELLRDLDLSVGSKVTVEKTSNEAITIKKTSPRKTMSNTDKDFQKWLKVFMKENGEALDELAER